MRSRNIMFGSEDGDGDEFEMAPIMITQSEEYMEEVTSDVELKILSERYKKRTRGMRTLRIIAVLATGAILFSIATFTIINSTRRAKNRKFKDVNKIPTHEAFGRVQSKYLPSRQASVHLYKHKKTQAEFMAYVPTDSKQDKAFGISFRTKPTSDNGVAHILEHSVLSGSKKYPAKDPFLILMKGSLNTFLNAMTYPDRTVYPVASRNKKDFMNLMNVYLDAVFAPKCVTKAGDWVLQQEGWRYDVDDEGDLKLNGVVYSEMKGVFSDPLSVLDQKTNELLFPDNTYRFESGGSPTSIPTLTQADFVDFYNKHYHPSNSQSFVSGTVEDVMAAMDVIDSYLSQYEYNGDLKKKSQIQFQQKRLVHHLYQSHPYAVQKLEEDEGQHIMCITWLLNDTTMPPRLELAFDILDYLLVGTPSAPLIKSLTESGLGSSVIGNGLSTGLLQDTFAIGMKGVKGNEIENLEALVFGVLEGVVKDGFGAKEIEAALNSFEFQIRETHTSSTPVGVSVFLQSLGRWNYDASPLDAIDFEDSWQELTKPFRGNDQMASNYFVHMVKSYLLNNPHRVHMELQPSVTLEQDMIDQEAAKLKAFQGTLSPKEFNDIKAKSQHVKDVQNAIDPPSVVNTIPSLSLADIDKTGIEYDISVNEHAFGSATTLTTNIAQGNAGIVYIDIGIDISDLSYANVPMIPFIISMMDENDTENYSRAELDTLIGIDTGGISMSLELMPLYERGQLDYIASNSKKMRSILFFRGKCTVEKASNLLALIEEIVHKSLPVSQEKAVQILERQISSLEASLVSSGHSYAVRRMHARYDYQSLLSEHLYGFSQYMFLKEILIKAKNNWDFFEQRIRKVMGSFSEMHSSETIINLTGDSSSIQKLGTLMELFITNLKNDASSPNLPNFYNVDHPWMKKVALHSSESDPLRDEGIPISSQVSYVGEGGTLFNHGEKIRGGNCVPLQFLRKGYLWDNVRAKNGAYGVSTSLDQTDGTLYMVSYRDPQLLKTIDVYDNAGDYLSGELEDKAITSQTIKTAIVGCIGDIDGSALPPRQVGWLAFRRYLSGSMSDRRQRWRDEILSAQISDFKIFAEKLQNWAENSTIVAVAPESKLASAAQASRPLFVLSADPS